ncbi:hypothetical protein ABKN59_008009 [Abortiporus biennis]
MFGESSLNTVQSPSRACDTQMIIISLWPPAYLYPHPHRQLGPVSSVDHALLGFRSLSCHSAFAIIRYHEHRNQRQDIFTKMVLDFKRIASIIDP